MTHQIKIKRAKNLCNFLPQQESEIWNSIPDELIKTLTGKQLALVCKTLDCHWKKAIAFSEFDIVENGCVWSKKHNALLDVVLAGNYHTNEAWRRS